MVEVRVRHINDIDAQPACRVAPSELAALDGACRRYPVLLMDSNLDPTPVVAAQFVMEGSAFYFELVVGEA